MWLLTGNQLRWVWLLQVRTTSPDCIFTPMLFAEKRTGRVSPDLIGKYICSWDLLL